MDWHTDTGRPILKLMDADEVLAMNTDYWIESGFHLFTLQPENLSDRTCCIIAARTFSWSAPLPN